MCVQGVMLRCKKSLGSVFLIMDHPLSERLRKTFRNKYHHFWRTLNRNKGNSGRSRSARTEENISLVRNLLQNDPRNISARRNGFGISPASLNRITREELKWHPYRIIVRHTLKQADCQRRLTFSRWFVLRPMP